MARIYLAGAEKVETLRTLVENGVRHVLFSFFYIARRGQQDALFSLLDQYPDTQVILDSGAFSFKQRQIAQGMHAQRQSPEQYFLRYRDFVRDFGYRFTFAVELDIEGVDGLPLEQVRAWREQLVDLGTCPIVPVWHADTRTYEEWDEYCLDPRLTHLGLGSWAVTVGQRMRLVSRAHAFGKAVHGFAETKVLTTLGSIKYDTIDSTSWMAGAQYGIVYILKGRNWIVLEKKDKHLRKHYGAYFRSIGVEPAQIITDQGAAVEKANIIAWRNLGARLAVLHKSHVDSSLKILSRNGETLYLRSTDVRRLARTRGQETGWIGQTATAKESVRRPPPKNLALSDPSERLHDQG